VEYQIPGVSHLSIQRAAGNEKSDAVNPFASSMMAFLRMDPDVGMFGEIRDSLSAQIAYTAIQTGHKLMTTVHATSALGIISRLPIWTGNVRRFLDKYPPWVLYRDFSGAMLIVSLSTLMRSGVSLRSSLERSLRFSSPWLGWHTRNRKTSIPN